MSPHPVSANESRALAADHNRRLIVGVAPLAGGGAGVARGRRLLIASRPIRERGARDVTRPAALEDDALEVPPGERRILVSTVDGHAFEPGDGFVALASSCADPTERRRGDRTTHERTELL